MADTFENTEISPQLTETDLEGRLVRSEERARDRAQDNYQRPDDGVTGFIAEHPISAVLGGIALGVLIGSAIPGRRVGRKVSDLATTVGELTAAYAAQAWNAASDVVEAGGDTLEDLGDAAADRTRMARRDAAYYAATTKDAATAGSRDAAKASRRGKRDLFNLFG